MKSGAGRHECVRLRPCAHTNPRFHLNTLRHARRLAERLWGKWALAVCLPAFLLARVLTQRQEANDKSDAQAGEILFRTPSGMIYHDGQKNKILMARRHYPGACHVRALSARRRHPAVSTHVGRCANSPARRVGACVPCLALRASKTCRTGG